MAGGKMERGRRNMPAGLSTELSCIWELRLRPGRLAWRVFGSAKGTSASAKGQHVPGVHEAEQRGERQRAPAAQAAQVQPGLVRCLVWKVVGGE